MFHPSVERGSSSSFKKSQSNVNSSVFRAHLEACFIMCFSGRGVFLTALKVAKVDVVLFPLQCSGFNGKLKTLPPQPRCSGFNYAKLRRTLTSDWLVRTRS